MITHEDTVEMMHIALHEGYACTLDIEDCQLHRHAALSARYMMHSLATATGRKDRNTSQEEHDLRMHLASEHHVWHWQELNDLYDIHALLHQNPLVIHGIMNLHWSPARAWDVRKVSSAYHNSNRGCY